MEKDGVDTVWCRETINKHIYRHLWTHECNLQDAVCQKGIKAPSIRPHLRPSPGRPRETWTLVLSNGKGHGSS